MLRKLLAAVFVVFLTPVLAFGQSAVITGTVTDGDGEPLIGANIVIDDLVIGSATDLDGRYTFEVPSSQVNGQQVALRARYVGFSPQIRVITLNSGTQVQDFTLINDRLRLDEVVVTGVSSATPAKKLAFTVDKLDASAVELAPAANAVASLAGKVAGAAVTATSGQPGSGTSVRLRGTTSLSGSSSPLYIVDGVILGSSTVDIGALDIENIEIVKGAAASSLYGSRAQNGVIQITTKRGGEVPFNQTRITVRNEFGLNQLSQDFRANGSHNLLAANGSFIDDNGNAIVCSADDIAARDCIGPGYSSDTEIDFSYGDTGQYSGASFFDKPYADLQSATFNAFESFFDPGNTYTNYIAVSQNSAKTNFHSSFSNFQEGGVLPGMNGYNRKSFRINLDHRITQKLSLSASSFYASSTRDVPTSNGAFSDPFFGLMFTNPLVDIGARDAQGELYVQADPFSVEDNPLYVINNVDTDDQSSRVLTNARVRYSPFDFMDIDGNIAYDRRDSDFSRFIDKGTDSIDEISSVKDGSILRQNDIREALNADLTVSLRRTFDAMTTRAQFKYQAESSETYFEQAFGIGLAAGGIEDLDNVDSDGSTVGSSTTNVRSDGLYATVGVDYQDKYIADLLIRRDGSSLFGPDERWQTYYRASAAWRFSEESFYPFKDVIEEFKLRYSLGTAGGRPSFSAQYETFSLNGGSISKATLGNRVLRPELQTEQEFGMDLGISNRVSASLTYAKARVEDQLLQVPLQAAIGFGSQWQNAGTIESNTWEATVDFNVLNSRDLSLDFGIVLDRTRQEITEFNRGAWKTGPLNAFYFRSGETIGAMYGIHWMTDFGELENIDSPVFDPEGTQIGSNEITSGNGVPRGFVASAFDVNDDGLLVPVGEGNSYRDGWANGLWGERVDVNGDGSADLLFGIPIQEVNEAGQPFTQIGDVLPDFNFGWTTNVRYKGLSAYMLWNAQVGGDIYNHTAQWSYRDDRHSTQDQSDKPSDLKKPEGYYQALYAVNAVNDWYIEDATYLKLREVSLSYALGRERLQQWFGNSLYGLSVSMVGRNLLTFTDYSGWDPDVGAGNDNTLYRVDSFEYPPYRSFTGRVEIQF